MDIFPPIITVFACCSLSSVDPHTQRAWMSEAVFPPGFLSIVVWVKRSSAWSCSEHCWHNQSRYLYQWARFLVSVNILCTLAQTLTVFVWKAALWSPTLQPLNFHCSSGEDRALSSSKGESHPCFWLTMQQSSLHFSSFHSPRLIFSLALYF